MPSNTYRSVNYIKSDESETFEDVSPFENVFEGGDEEIQGYQNAKVDTGFKQKNQFNKNQKINDKKV